MQMFPSNAPPANITTEQIQKLDENKKLILAIMENQNLGKLTECAQYQAHLTGYGFPDDSTASCYATAKLLYATPTSFSNGSHQLQDPQQQIHQQAMQGHMGIRPMGINNGMQHSMQQPESAAGGSGSNVGIRGK